MYGNFQQVPYPTHKSPMEGDTATRDLDWIFAASTDRTFVFSVGEFGVTKQQKLDLLQYKFWPALARWVISRQLVLPEGPAIGGWWRADMQGMMDWYRECFHMVSRWDDAIAAHADGVWKVALQTSPWRDWPEFLPLLKEPELDGRGRPKTDKGGKIIYRDRDPCSDGMEDWFMDVWESVANVRPLEMISNHRDRARNCAANFAHAQISA